MSVLLSGFVLLASKLLSTIAKFLAGLHPIIDQSVDSIKCRYIVIEILAQMCYYNALVS